MKPRCDVVLPGCDLNATDLRLKHAVSACSICLCAVPRAASLRSAQDAHSFMEFAMNTCPPIRSQMSTPSLAGDRHDAVTRNECVTEAQTDRQTEASERSIDIAASRRVPSTPNAQRRRLALFAAAAPLAPYATALAGALSAVFGVSREALAADAPAPANTIIVDNFSFAPSVLNVAVGTTVVWINHDDIPHTVVSDASPRVFKSPPLDTDDKFSFTFAQAGTFKYFCSIHSHMTGTVVVK